MQDFRLWIKFNEKSSFQLVQNENFNDDLVPPQNPQSNPVPRFIALYHRLQGIFPVYPYGVDFLDDIAFRYAGFGRRRIGNDRGNFLIRCRYPGAVIAIQFIILGDLRSEHGVIDADPRTDDPAALPDT